MSKYIIPRWETRRGKLFYIKLSMLIIGIMLLIWVWYKRDTKDVSAEVAGILLGISAGYMFQLGIPLLVPCKKLIKEEVT